MKNTKFVRFLCLLGRSQIKFYVYIDKKQYNYLLKREATYIGQDAKATEELESYKKVFASLRL